jgi:diguanylate cyclase (GGDEF)-like protein
MARIFEKDYKYLLANLVPLHRLSPVRRRQVRAATAGSDPAEMRVAAFLALEELYESQYFDRTRTHEENGYVVVTYVKNEGSYQIRLAMPAQEWNGLAEEVRRKEGRPPRLDSGAPAVAEPQLVETTISVLPDIIGAFSINGERKSTVRRLEAVIQAMPEWLRFTNCRLVVIEERLAEDDALGEFVVTLNEETFHENVIYQRCRYSRRTAVLDLSGARSVGMSPPGTVSKRGEGVKNAALAVAPVFAQDEFWGVLEVWSAGDDNGTLFRERVGIASAIIERIIENIVLLENLTSIDALTGLYNRQAYDRLVPIEMERATRSGTRLSMLVLDVDDFSMINDTIGHQKGDEALVVVTDLIRGNLRKIDLAFRYGGEEFAILLPGTGEVEAIHTAERLRAVISGYQDFLDNGGARWQITVSIGGAVFPDHAQTQGELFTKADDAMYAAKEKGKDRVEFHRE